MIGAANRLLADGNSPSVATTLIMAISELTEKFRGLARTRDAPGCVEAPAVVPAVIGSPTAHAMLPEQAETSVT